MSFNLESPSDWKPKGKRKKVSEKYGVIFADPNWRYRNFGARKHGSPKTHYETRGAHDIGKIPVKKWTKADSILILCVPWPKLSQGFYVAGAWGFNEYITGIPWIKTSPNAETEDSTDVWKVLIRLIKTGIGFWFQSTSETLLFFRRGNPPSPDGSATHERKPVKGIMCGSEGVLYAPVRGHSAKPLGIYEYCQKKLKGPYLELFARNKIHGWSCWGSETGYFLSEEGVSRIKEEKE